MCQKTAGARMSLTLWGAVCFPVNVLNIQSNKGGKEKNED